MDLLGLRADEESVCFIEAIGLAVRIIKYSVEVTVVVSLVLRKFSETLVEGHFWTILPVENTNLVFQVSVLILTEKLFSNAHDRFLGHGRVERD